ncbi:MAG: selenoneine biosynthesis selenosugar synthase SenB [Rubrivivax sp.]
MKKPVLCLVTPALAGANNGNWQTAFRWARMLSADFAVRLQQRWDGTPADVMVALHARRSAESIAAWAGAFPQRALAVVLTGTDLYRDILVDPAAQSSLQLAQRLIVLHELAALDLPAALRGKCRVCLQSVPARRPLVKPATLLRCLMVGHLRDEKSPRTYFDAARALAARRDIRLDHIGAALDADLGAQARALQREQPRYRWLGELAHGTTRSRIQRAHLLVHASRIEGGAHVVIEAVRSGTPVLASRIPGNVGLLGADYGGYFEPGDSAALARSIERCRDDATMLDGLRAQCDRRAPLFDPQRERATLRHVVAEMMAECNPPAKIIFS